MIIVCACCTIRIPRATIEIANSAIATGTMNEPMLSISALLVHVQRCPIDPHHHDPGAGLDHGVHERAAAPVLTLHQDPAPARPGVDPLGHHSDPAHERVHVGLDLAAGRVQALQQEGADAREREQRPGGEAQDGRQVSRHHERDRARQHAPHRHAQQPEPRRQDLGDEQEQRGHEPDLPCGHGYHPPETLEGIARTPRQRPATLAASGLSNTPGGGSLKRRPHGRTTVCIAYSPREAPCSYPAWPSPSAYSARCSRTSIAPSPSSPSDTPSPATTSPCTTWSA